MSGATPTVGTVACLGGCGRDLDLELYPEGMCPECEAREYRKNAEAWREEPPEDYRP